MIPNRGALTGNELKGVLIPAMPANENDFARAAIMASRRFVTELKVIEERMTDLRRVTREVPGWSICLDIQRRRNIGSFALRWRNTTGGHVPDAEVMTILKNYPPALREWYCTVQLHALWLNAVERLCRKAGIEFSGLADSIGGVLIQHAPLAANTRVYF